MKVVNAAEGLFEGYGAVSGVQVEDVYAIGAELLERGVYALGEAFGLVLTWVLRVTFGCERQAAFLPFGIACERFLLSADVRTGSVNFVVAL